MSKLQSAYQKFLEQGGSGRANVNELLKVIVEAIEPKSDKPTPKEK